MPAYLNSDGLYWKTGQSEGVAGNAGEFVTGGNVHWVEFELDMPSLTLAPAILDDNVILPVGARIEEVVTIAEVACTGATAVFNVGLYRTDRTTPIAAGGIVAAMPLASVDTQGEENVLRVGTTYAGTLIGQTLANPALVTADYDTAAFTAGRVIVRIRWYKP